MQVLSVCTGNLARSPAIERLFDVALSHAGIVAASAGTAASVSEPIAAPMAALLRSVGAGTDGFAARQLTEEMVLESDLVITATRAHRTATVQLAPAAVRYTFTLIELARLALLVPPEQITGYTHAERLRSLVEVAPTYRASAGHGPSSLADPYGRNEVIYRRCFDVIFASTLDIVKAITR
ncbi:MAG: low molecular weight phosphatase family protein [Micrococcales bacterium]|nr:low molecular weight phosphatase family protein [Micrococcales bacterium]MCL2668430.1 low molecular weight phosphatase family protein [Micrococcales bacterium]